MYRDAVDLQLQESQLLFLFVPVPKLFLLWK